MANIKTLSFKSLLIIGFAILFLAGCKRPKLGNNKQTGTKPASVDTSIIAIIPYSIKDDLSFGDSEPAVITKEDIPVIESALANCLKHYNAKSKMLFEDENTRHPNYKLNEEYFMIDLKNYKRQYVAIVNDSGEKEVWVNCFCSTWGTDWKKQVVIVGDSGDCYFTLKINLATGEYYDLIVNGYVK